MLNIGELDVDVEQFTFPVVKTQCRQITGLPKLEFTSENQLLVIETESLSIKRSWTSEYGLPPRTMFLKG